MKEGVTNAMNTWW